MAKTYYARQIQHDLEIPDTIVRTSTLPEELGRIEYLLTDKTGTLTRNGMHYQSPSTNPRNGTEEVAHGYCRVHLGVDGRGCSPPLTRTGRCFT